MRARVPMSRFAIAKLLAVAFLGFILGRVTLEVSHGWPKSSSVAERQLAYDTRLNANTPPGITLDPQQKLGVVLGMGGGQLPPSYLTVLQRKLGPRGLKLTVVFPNGVPNEVLSSWRASGIPFVIDHDQAYERLLNASLAHPHGATLVYGPDLKVKFHLLRIVDNDLLRQLVEKYLLGNINYTPMESAASSLTGQAIDELDCGSGTQIPRGRLIVLFPPGCSSCQLKNYAPLLGTKGKRVQGSLSGAGDPLFVFLGGSDQKARALIESLSVKPENVCTVSTSFLFDTYSTRMRGFVEPIVLATNANGIVEEVRSLSRGPGETK
jgi:hypothetical protein